MSESDFDASSVGDVSDHSDCSDYEDNSKAVAQAKRRKVNPVKRRRGKPAKSLSILPTMPMDVVFEIFTYLTPADLLNIARTAKCFRQWLMQKSAITIWKAAIKTVEGEGSPGCPSDLSEPQWANLIWGGSMCQECGKSRTNDITFIFRTRVCKFCLKRRLIAESDFQKVYPMYDDTVLDLIPHTEVFRYGRNRKYFWHYDIVRQSQKLAPLLGAVQKAESGAESVLSEFKALQKQGVIEIMQHASLAEKWMAIVLRDNTIKGEQAKQQRQQDIRDRLSSESWNKEDIDSVMWHVGRDNNKRPLTELSWKRIRPGLVAHLNEIQTSRLKKEMDSIIAVRKRLATVAVEAAAKQLPTSEINYLPDMEVVHTFDELSNLINAAREVSLFSEDFHKVCKGLSGILKNWLRQKEDSISSLVPPELIDAAAPVSPARLAATIFQCDHCKISSHLYMGFEDAVLYRHRDNFAWNRVVYVAPKLSFHSRASEAVRALLALLGLDAQRTTTQAFDQIDARFFCEHCELTWVKGTSVYGRVAMGWRQAVKHYVDFATIKPTNLRLGPADQLATVKQMESYHDTKSIWMCCHCRNSARPPVKISPNGKTVAASGTIDAVRRHLELTHNIKEPLVHRDYIWRFADGCPDTIPYAFSMGTLPKGVALPPRPDTTRYSCNHCPGHRTFLLNGVRDHIKAKHRIVETAEDRDYKRHG